MNNTCPLNANWGTISYTCFQKKWTIYAAVRGNNPLTRPPIPIAARKPNQNHGSFEPSKLKLATGSWGGNRFSRPGQLRSWHATITSLTNGILSTARI